VIIQIIQMGSDRDLFLDAITGAVPLEERDRVRVVRVPAGVTAPKSPLPSPVALTIEGDGVVISGRAPGVNRAQISELRGGRVRPEEELDLHGHTAAEAERALERFLVNASALHRRCVLVIHGRGTHSGDVAQERDLAGDAYGVGGVAVLRDTVIGALVGEMSGLVRAFATAARADGGAGATYVMVRA
jgi:DNA-nicking Smr family endonuclease